MSIKKLLVLGMFTLSLPGCSSCTYNGLVATAKCTGCNGIPVPIQSGVHCTQTLCDNDLGLNCPNGIVQDAQYTPREVFLLEPEFGCTKVESRETLTSDIPFAMLIKQAASLNRVLFGDATPSNQANAGESCPAGVHFTIKIVNNATDCTDNTLYYKLTYQGTGGPQEVGPISVAPGGTGTQSVVAADSDQDGRADTFSVSWSVFDPDPVLGCGSGQADRDGTFAEGDTYTLTLSGDGGTANEVTTHAANRATSRTGAVTSQNSAAGKLVPVPDPNFSAGAED